MKAMPRPTSVSRSAPRALPLRSHESAPRPHLAVASARALPDTAMVLASVAVAGIAFGWMAVAATATAPVLEAASALLGMVKGVRGN